jgi:hypothetical protein
MAIKTSEQMLEEVQTAISRILERGEENQHENWRLREANLAALQARELELIRRVEVEKASLKGISRRQNISYTRG